MLQMLYYRNFSLWLQSFVSCCFGLILLISQPTNTEDIFVKNYSTSSSDILHVNKLVTEVEDVHTVKGNVLVTEMKFRNFWTLLHGSAAGCRRHGKQLDSEYSFAEAKADLNKHYFDGATDNGVSTRPSNFSIDSNIFKINWYSILFWEVLKTFLTEEEISTSDFFLNSSQKHTSHSI